VTYAKRTGTSITPSRRLSISRLRDARRRLQGVNLNVFNGVLRPSPSSLAGPEKEIFRAGAAPSGHTLGSAISPGISACAYEPTKGFLPAKALQAAVLGARDVSRAERVHLNSVAPRRRHLDPLPAHKLAVSRYLGTITRPAPDSCPVRIRTTWAHTFTGLTESRRQVSSREEGPASPARDRSRASLST